MANPPLLKVQACQFKRSALSPVETGLAFLTTFNVPDVKFIVDVDGERVKNVHTFTFPPGEAFTCLQTEVTNASRRSYTI
jgi:hypothetical protein